MLPGASEKKLKKNFTLGKERSTVEIATYSIMFMLNCETSKKENMELKQKVEDETRTANPVIDKPEETGISKKSETGETKPKIIKAQQTDKKVSLSKLVPIGIKETIFKAGLDLILPAELNEIQGAIDEINKASVF